MKNKLRSLIALALLLALAVSMAGCQTSEEMGEEAMAAGNYERALQLFTPGTEQYQRAAEAASETALAAGEYDLALSYFTPGSEAYYRTACAIGDAALAEENAGVAYNYYILLEEGSPLYLEKLRGVLACTFANDLSYMLQTCCNAMGTEGPVALGEIVREYLSDGSTEKVSTLLKDLDKNKASDAADQVRIALAPVIMSTATDIYGRTEARGLLDAVKNKYAPGFAEAQEEVEHAIGMQLLKEGSHVGAYNALKCCPSDPHAVKYVEIYRLFESGSIRAAEEALAAWTDVPDPMYLTALGNALGEFVGGMSFGTVDEALATQHLYFSLSGRLEAPWDKAQGRKDILWHLPLGQVSEEMPELAINFSKAYFTDLNALYKQCGTDPQGKVLIIYEMNEFKGDKYYAIQLKAMRGLPGNLIPKSLAEVEYVILATSGYSTAGSYTKGTIAVREYGALQLLQMPRKTVLYTSGQKYGPTPPQTFMYSGSPPAFKSGGGADLFDNVMAAVEKVISLS